MVAEMTVYIDFGSLFEWSMWCTSYSCVSVCVECTLACDFIAGSYGVRVTLSVVYECVRVWIVGL